jgi:hypothetical protein
MFVVDEEVLFPRLQADAAGFYSRRDCRKSLETSPRDSTKLLE